MGRGIAIMQSQRRWRLVKCGPAMNTRVPNVQEGAKSRALARVYVCVGGEGGATGESERERGWRLRRLMCPLLKDILYFENL